MDTSKSIFDFCSFYSGSFMASKSFKDHDQPIFNIQQQSEIVIDNNKCLTKQGLIQNKRASSSVYVKNKKKKMKIFDQCEIKGPSANSVDQRVTTVRRSQKLSDKITALQKLVSPYGKTDTASVLQEACFYIQILQEQIKNLYQMLTTSYNNVSLYSQEIELKESELRRRGLCLVPISVAQKLIY